MLPGFAMIAYPAQHGVSGEMTFMVNREGVIHLVRSHSFEYCEPCIFCPAKNAPFQLFDANFLTSVGF